MEEELKKKTEETIKRMLESGITNSNIDNLYKLTKMNHIAKEDIKMNYGNYGEYNGREYNEYGRYGRDNYGRRGYDMRYRGHENIDRMANEYGRYMENRERYGAGEETDKSFHYMIKALEDFIMVLNEEAVTPQQKMELKSTLQKVTM